MNNTSNGGSDPHTNGVGTAAFPKIFTDKLQDGVASNGCQNGVKDASNTYPAPAYHSGSNGQQQSAPPSSSNGFYSTSSPNGLSGYTSVAAPGSTWSSSTVTMPLNGSHQAHAISSGSGSVTAQGALSSSGGGLPVPQLSTSTVVPSAAPGSAPASYPHPAMGHISHAAVHQPPTSAPGVLGTTIQGGLGPYGQNSISAGPQAADMAARALAGVQGGTAVSSGLSVQGLAALVTRPQLGDDLYCSCPMVCVVGTNHGAPHAVPLSIMNLQFEVNCHISQAFVDMQMVCNYPMAWNDAPLVFFLPKTTDTTITELAIENMVRPSIYATAVVPLDDMKRYGGKGGAGAVGAAGEPDDVSAQDPEMFMLPLPPGLPGDQYRVKLSYFHPMTFDTQQGKYVLRLPTTIPPLCLAQGSSPNSVLNISVAVNTGSSEEVQLMVPSHPIMIKDKSMGSVAFELDANQMWENGDFVAGYSVWRDQMTASVHVEPPVPDMPDQRGTFALNITPPGPEYSVRFPRSCVFMFDRSGSMTGDPIRYAKAALLNGLHMLTPEDKFTVVAFDHEQLWWTDRLIEATPENILTCMHWVNDDLSARGTTDINSPLQRALKLLSGVSGLPFVFLLTDGCVDDERDICIMAENAIKSATRIDINNIVVTTDGATVTAVNPAPPSAPTAPVLSPRIYTFGIGPYCNHYFLKRLAAIGRGMNDVAFRPHAIQQVMERMLAAAALPMLSDVQIRVQGLTQVELYPFPIPDVFVGQPLLVSGKFEGDWPETVDICGTLPDGSNWTQTIPTLPAGDLPLHKVFVKSQLDLMTAHAWMAGNPPNLVQQIVDLSMASGVTSAHTAMVGFETTPQRYEQLQAVPPSERRKKIVRWAIGGAAGIGLVAGVAAALTFGDLASTMANMPVGDAMAAMGGDLGGFFEGLGDAMDCCGGGCDCCGDCGDVCGACITC